jgi:hypothetical protein
MSSIFSLSAHHSRHSSWKCVGAFAERTLAVPNYRTVRRRAEAVDARTIIRRRDGAKRAREKLGPLSVSSLQPQRALEVVQIDHTLVDVIVVDGENRQPIGRPWLTLSAQFRQFVDDTLRLVVNLVDERPLARYGKLRPSPRSSWQERIGTVSQLVLNASTDCDMYERRARYRKGLKVWKSLLVPLTPEARRSLARVSRAWPPSLQRRLASALKHTTRRDSFYVASAPIHSVRDLSTNAP